MLSDVMKRDEDDFKRKFLYALSRLGQDDWNRLEDFVESVLK